ARRSRCGPTARPPSRSAPVTAASSGRRPERGSAPRHPRAIARAGHCRGDVQQEDRMLVRLALPLLLVTLVGVQEAAAQGIDLSKTLVGTWKGEVQMASGTYPRTLIIKSVEVSGRRAVADAQYGGSGGYGGPSGTTLEPVDLQIE